MVAAELRIMASMASNSFVRSGGKKCAKLIVIAKTAKTGKDSGQKDAYAAGSDGSYFFFIELPDFLLLLYSMRSLGDCEKVLALQSPKRNVGISCQYKKN